MQVKTAVVEEAGSSELTKPSLSRMVAVLFAFVVLGASLALCGAP